MGVGPVGLGCRWTDPTSPLDFRITCTTAPATSPTDQHPRANTLTCCQPLGAGQSSLIGSCWLTPSLTNIWTVEQTRNVKTDWNQQRKNIKIVDGVFRNLGSTFCRRTIWANPSGTAGAFRTITFAAGTDASSFRDSCPCFLAG